MQKIIATKTVSLTDLRNPMKVIRDAGNSPVAILNRNKVVGYFVPEAIAGKNDVTYLSNDAFEKMLPELVQHDKTVLEYLKDK
jgi:antitoxin StbD